MILKNQRFYLSAVLLTTTLIPIDNAVAGDCDAFGQVFEAIIRNTPAHSAGKEKEIQWSVGLCNSNNATRRDEVFDGAVKAYSHATAKQVGKWYADIEGAKGDRHPWQAHYGAVNGVNNGQYWDHVIDRGVRPAMMAYW